MTLELHATPDEVMRAVQAFQQFAQTQQIPEKTAFGLALALEECGSNIVNHALRRTPQQTFVITFERVGDELFIEMRDHGPEFDPTAWKGPESETACEDAIGGWGIQIVRRYTDAIRYKRNAGENILRLSKQLRPEDDTTDVREPQTKHS